VGASVGGGWNRLGTLLVGASMLLKGLLGSFVVGEKVAVVLAYCPWVCWTYDQVLLLFVEILRHRDRHLHRRCLFAVILRMIDRACHSSFAFLLEYSSRLRQLVCLTFHSD